MKATITIGITFLLYLICHAQEKETVSKKSLSYTLSSQTPEIIYINFDKDKGDVKLTQESGEMLFSLKKADSRYNKHTLLFTFHPKEMSRKKIRYDSIRKQIINGIEAKNKVDLLLEKRAQKCESELDQKDKNNTIYCNMIRHPFIYEYNSYFKIIYLYEPIDAEHGTLYEVTWNFYVE